jgi:hypothetical protein
MDPELVDRIYESSFVPELWPGVLGELAQIIEAPRGSLIIFNREGTRWTASPDAHERTQRVVNEDWLQRGQFAARLFGARHAGFLTENDVFIPDELDLEPLYRDFFSTGWFRLGRWYGASHADRRKNLSRLDSPLRTRTG